MKKTYVVDFKNVSTEGLESSTFAKQLAGVRANEARYFMNKYNHTFTVIPAGESKEVVEYVHTILKKERNIEFASKPLETAQFQVEGDQGPIKWTYIFYESGLSVNVLYTVDSPAKRAVGFKLCEDMEVPKELSEFKFARQKSTLAGVIRGSYFVIKGEY